MNECKLSVIVPTYNVEEYLFECLESLNAQTLKGMQVIIVDDGSTDQSGKIAEDYANTHENFEYYRKVNGGLGQARNYGLQFVRGQYVTFVDSDDIIDKFIYEIALNELKASGAEMAVFDVMRFNSKRAWGSKLQRLAFDGAESVTHITKHPQLIYDAISCNKVISFDFWKKHDFRFPEGMLYEDIPVTIPLHYLCNKVAVIDKVGYYWRARDGASVSITQNRGDAKNFLDRLKAVKKIDAFFREHDITNQALIDEKLIRALEIDFLTYVNIVDSIPDELCELFFTELKNYIEENIPLEYFEKISVLNHQKYQYIMDGNREALVALLQNQATDYASAIITERDDRFYIECSDDLFEISKRDVTEEFKKLRPNKYIYDSVAEGQTIELSGYLYFPRLDVPTPAMQRVEAFLVNSFSGNRIPLEVNSIKNQELTKSSGFVYNAHNKKEYHYNYDGTGFKIKLDISKIDINELNEGENRIELVYENRLRSGREWLWAVNRSIFSKIENTAVRFKDQILRLNMNTAGEVVCTLGREPISAVKTQIKHEKLTVGLNSPAEAIYAESPTGEKIDLVKARGGLLFEAALPSFCSNVGYSFFVKPAGEPSRRLICAGKAVSFKPTAEKVAFLSSVKTFFLNLSLLDSGSFLKAKSFKNGVATISISAAGSIAAITPTAARVVVYSEVDGNPIILAETRPNISCSRIRSHFKIDFKHGETTKNLTHGYRDIYVEYIAADGSVTKHPLLSQRGFKFTHELADLSLKFYRNSLCQVRLMSRLVWPTAQNSSKKRQTLVEKEYPKYLEMPINPKLVLFESMWGQKYSCNPRAIYEYIDENYPEYDCVWAFNDPRMPITGHGRRVRRGSLEYYEVLATAKYLVNNVNFTAAGAIKREGQIEINTMHGTPYKTIGLDSVADFNTEDKRQKYLAKCGRWDHLTVQGSFTEEKAEHCFGFKNNILRTGYPRCDALFQNNTEVYKSAVKEKLGLPADKKVIVYAPTWRVQGKFDMQLDVHKLKAMLGDEYILVTKIHHLCSQVYDLPKIEGFVYDLTEYNSIEDLYLIADILITDYSSVMFDYGILKKPQIFYVYDLAEYEENLRGVYFDLKTEAPGSIVYTTEELAEAVLNINNQSEEIMARTESFNNKYINFECENSSEKVFNEVFTPDIDLK